MTQQQQTDKKHKLLPLAPPSTLSPSPPEHFLHFSEETQATNWKPA
jgi:hypothetical protein